MDTQYIAPAPGLVYHHTSSFFDHHPRPFSIVQNGHQPMAWQPQQAHTSPPNSTASTSSSLSTSSLYSAASHSNENIDYPSTSTSLTQPRTADVYPSPAIDARTSAHDTSYDSPQIESSIGPSRVLTRRRARTTTHPPSRPYNRRTHSLAFADQQGSRPPSPLRHPPPPPYASVSSDLDAALGVAPYAYAYYHARAGSSSVSSNPRSASPANSVISMASSRTSYSSSFSASGSQLHHQQSPDGVRQAKHRKQKLWSTDRKQICVCHRDNPGMKQEEIAARFGVERSTVSKILKEKDRWLNVRDDEKLQVSKWRSLRLNTTCSSGSRG
ncbi:hypothetical protein DAEQUDRAFT_570032 [Daedalea quercina L-15889]|uniref:HTH psq-type domain-containing protein n=1 Tax=Daedalea quercina L-15889 TaxID=1314783 RepID=A0A165LWG0_9APHY|nr:hypothetical protein DAEQUDRAFT_570032 [Daedalea quercina L-15889]